jgi:uncharacterized protein
MGPDLDAAAAWVRTRLDAGLPAHLEYHRAAHTCEDVVPAAARLAGAEGIVGRDRVLLLTAALFHDLGFVIRPEGHEEIGIGMARTELPDLGYGIEDLEVVATLIRATRLPQRPETHLAGLLADADLDVLGRDDFPDRNAALRRELAAQGRPFDDAGWCDDQIAFMAAHRYHTAAARSLRDEGKAANLAGLQARRHGLAG